jgi:hypothetical protein
MLRQTEFISLFNNNLQMIQNGGELQNLPYLTEGLLSRLLPKRQYYSQGDIPLVIDLLQKQQPEATREIQGRQVPKRWRQWVESTKKQTEQKEDVLWSRKRYQQDLDRMAEKWGISKEGFTNNDMEQAFRGRLHEYRLRNAFEADLGQIVAKHCSSRLPLGNEWIWAVERHLLSREQGRLAARLMVEIMAQTHIEIDYDRWGEPIGVHANIKANTPDIVIKEVKKDLKKIERELKLPSKSREKISHRRNRAKELYRKPASGIGLHSDRKLRQRYGKLVED